MIMGMGRFLNLFKSPEALAREARAAQRQGQEMAQRERYWFDHPFGFQCRVALDEPRERTARVGAYGDGLFGSIPVPFHGSFSDWGQFQVQGDRFVFLGEHCTRVLLFTQILNTTHYDDGSVSFNYQGVRGGQGGVMGFHGPVRAAVVGALTQAGHMNARLNP
jgi:hypothetical protein